MSKEAQEIYDAMDAQAGSPDGMLHAGIKACIDRGAKTARDRANEARDKAADTAAPAAEEPEKPKKKSRGIF